MCQASYEVADVLSIMANGIDQQGYNNHQLRILRAIKECRTAALGGHVDACTNCTKIQISYNSCRNRHCPKCQGHQRAAWIQKRESELLPIPYFHVVFTLPAALNPLSMHNPRVVYDALFASAWQTLQAFGIKQQLLLGMVSILHTWGQNLSLHPHLHCIVPGGGVDKNGQLKIIRADGKYLFPVKAMSKIFRAKYVAILRKKGINDKGLFDSLFEKKWVVYTKRPFGNTQAVIQYIGRYTHKVAISNSRIQSVTKTEVSFSYKDYKDGSKTKEMTLTNQEFIRRFAQHILPHRFVRIRHYGILSSSWKRGKLKQLQATLKVVVKQFVPATKIHHCPHCHTATMITIDVFGKRGPPKKYLTVTKNNTA